MLDFTWLDISSYVVNCGIGIILSFVVVIGGMICFMVIVEIDPTDFTTKQAFGYGVYTLALLLFAIGLALIPTHDRILQVKIQNIKNQAVTKKNLDKGIEHIERVLKKLECKHLGCEDTKRKGD